MRTNGPIAWFGEARRRLVSGGEDGLGVVLQMPPYQARIEVVAVVVSRQYQIDTIEGRPGICQLVLSFLGKQIRPFESSETPIDEDLLPSHEDEKTGVAHVGDLEWPGPG
jgi:hypothetical protein